jgi:hypothetical protein
LLCWLIKTILWLKKAGRTKLLVPYFVTPLLPDLRNFYGRFLVNKKCSHDRPPVGSVSFGFNMAKSGVKPLIFLIGGRARDEFSPLASM